MLLSIAVILIIIWAIGFFARIVGHVIHAVLLVAFLFLIAHYFHWGTFGRMERASEHYFFPKKHRPESHR